MAAERASASANRPHLPTHEFIDHPSELVLLVRAGTFAELAGEAVAALASVMERGMKYVGESLEDEFTVEGTDRGAMLVDLLNEIILRAEANRFIPSVVSARLASASKLDVNVAGRTVAESPSLVKAATFHNLKVSDHDGVVEATVTFDI